MPIVLPDLVIRVSSAARAIPKSIRYAKSSLVEQNVGRFDVAVHQPDLVGGVQGFGHLLDDAHRPRRLQRPVGQHGWPGRGPR